MRRKQKKLAKKKAAERKRKKENSDLADAVCDTSKLILENKTATTLVVFGAVAYFIFKATKR